MTLTSYLARAIEFRKRLRQRSMISLDRTKTFIEYLFTVFRARHEFQRHRRCLQSGYFPIYLDYPVEPLVRYGWSTAPHRALNRLINSNRDAYRSLVAGFVAFRDGLSGIPREQPNDESSPYWSNDWIMGLDAVSLYAFVGLFKPKLYIEIGSGNSTKFVRKSIEDNLLSTQIISIDPHPRAEIDAICDEVIRSRLENISLDVFDRLNDGDILMIDNSHRCFQNSDVTTVFLDILPRLKTGVIIYIDDIYLPWDYPPEWSQRYYSEQYLLAVLLLADVQQRYEIVFPAWFISEDSQLRKIVEQSWKQIGIDQRNQIDGNGFWLRVKRSPNAADHDNCH